MDGNIKKLDTKIRSKDAELSALYTKIRKLEVEIPTLHNKKLLVKKLETAEMSLTGILDAIFETEEKEEEKE